MICSKLLRKKEFCILLSWRCVYLYQWYNFYFWRDEWEVYRGQTFKLVLDLPKIVFGNNISYLTIGNNDFQDRYSQSTWSILLSKSINYKSFRTFWASFQDRFACVCKDYVFCSSWVKCSKSLSWIKCYACVGDIDIFLLLTLHLLDTIQLVGEMS